MGNPSSAALNGWGAASPSIAFDRSLSYPNIKICFRRPLFSQNGTTALNKTAPTPSHTALPALIDTATKPNTMTFNAEAYLFDIRQTGNYAARHDLLERVAWVSDKNVGVLTEKDGDSQRFNLSIIGSVSIRNIALQPLGNLNVDYIKKNGNTPDFEKAKWQITLEAPPAHLPEYRSDFVAAISNLRKVQDLRGKTSTHKNMLDVGSAGSLRCVKSIFDKRELKFEDLGFVDDRDMYYPVPIELDDDYKKFILSYTVSDILIYDENENAVDVDVIRHRLPGCLVQLDFCPMHYRINNKREGTEFDSFTADIDQIIILRRGQTQTTSPVKRKAEGLGPIRASAYVPKDRAFTPASQITQAPPPSSLDGVFAHASSPVAGPSTRRSKAKQVATKASKAKDGGAKNRGRAGDNNGKGKASDDTCAGDLGLNGVEIVEGGDGDDEARSVDTNLATA